MHKVLVATSLAVTLALGSAAVAQNASPPSGTEPAVPAQPADPSMGTAAMPATPAVPAESPAASAMSPMAPTRVDNTLPPPPPGSLNKTYPVCTRGMTDNCQNAGEGGAPGRSRASDVRRSRP